MTRRTGWFGEPVRHGLSAKGIKTGQKLKNLRMAKMRDTDRDGLPDVMDCAPFNPKKQHKITKIRDSDGDTLNNRQLEFLMAELQQEMRKMGYTATVQREGAGIDFGNVRLGDKIVMERGLSVNQSGRKGRYLSWDDWVMVNNSLNRVMNKRGLSANIKSLGGQFKIREGFEVFDETDWSMGEGGRLMDTWQSEGKPRKILPSGRTVLVKKKDSDASRMIPKGDE